MRRPGAARGLMRQDALPRVFWILWAGTVVLRLGTVVQPFLALYLVNSRDASATDAGAVLAVIGLGGVLSQLVGGSLTDVVGRRATLTGGVLATALVLVGLAYAESVQAIVALAFLLGLTVDIYRPASQAIVADVVPEQARAKAFSLLVWAVNLGFSIAMVLGGLLARGGFSVLCWANALACVAFAGITWFFIPDTRGPHPAPSRGKGFAAVLRDRSMVLLVLLVLPYALVFMQAFSTLPLVMDADGLTPTTYGLVMAGNGVVCVVLQPLASRLIGSFPSHVVLSTGTAIVGVGYGVTALASSAAMYALSVVIWSLGETVVFAVATAVVAGLSPQHLRGRYNGVFGLVWAGGTLLAPLIGSWLLELGGPRVLWSVCAGLCVATAVGHILLAPALRPRASAAPLRFSAVERP